MVEIPLRCSHCGKTNIVDLSALETRPVDKVVNVEGYICSICEVWEPVFYYTATLLEKLARLENTAVGNKKFFFKFQKALRKAENLRSRF